MEKNIFLIVICVLVIILICALTRMRARENFSLTRLSQFEGLPGPVGWYYPLQYRVI